MTVWVLHQALTHAEQKTVDSRTHLILPFEGIPDLTLVNSSEQYRRVLQKLHPEAPPERIRRLTDDGWAFLGHVHPEDILVVPLPDLNVVAMAEVTGAYQFRINEAGEGEHSLPVKWHKKRLSFLRLGKFKSLFELRGEKRVYEVSEAPARTLIRERLPHSYNRFVKFKWLLILFFGWRAVMYIVHMAQPMR